MAHTIRLERDEKILRLECVNVFPFDRDWARRGKMAHVPRQSPAFEDHMPVVLLFGLIVYYDVG